MKKNLKNTTCNSQELCIGDGYVIPITTENNTKVDCKRYIGGDWKCITKPEDGGLRPNMSIIPNPFKRSECDILQNTPDTLMSEPQECELTENWYPKSWTDDEKEMIVKNGLCYKKNGRWKYKAKKMIKISSTPSGDPNLCPPFLRDFEGNILTDNNGVPLREETETEKNCPGDPTKYGFDENGTKPPEKDYSGLVKFIIVLFVLFFILFIILAIKKK
jgi:hypothetical protein